MSGALIAGASILSRTHHLQEVPVTTIAPVPDVVPGRSSGVEAGAPPTTGPELRPMWEQVLLYVFVIGPVVALGLGIWLAASTAYGPTWLDLGLAVGFYCLTGLGITCGFHRFFTHGSFKANRSLKIGLAIAGSMAVQGPVIRWVADHRKHHAFSDREGDPHSPWRFGTGPRALTKGLWWAHSGWLFDREQTSKYAPDLVADPDIAMIHKLFGVTTVATLLGPMLLGGVITMSWSGALSALLWAGAVRIFLLHHVTWSVNSVCHVFGERPFATRDKAANVWPLAIVSFGESWHNLHHADPTSARHGVDKGQIDLTAELIRGFERVGWASDVRWPTRERLERRRLPAS
jgi:stearoyl-CoA desaturase (delta-9 desaturase)